MTTFFIFLLLSNPFSAFASNCIKPYTCENIEQCGKMHENTGLLENGTVFFCGKSRLFICCPAPLTPNGSTENPQLTTTSSASLPVGKLPATTKGTTPSTTSTTVSKTFVTTEKSFATTKVTMPVTEHSTQSTTVAIEREILAVETDSSPAIRIRPNTTNKVKLPKLSNLKNHVNLRLLPNDDKCGSNEVLRRQRRAIDDDEDTGEFEISVVDGEEAPRGAFPWMALLFFEITRNNQTVVWPTCGGSLISSRYVLSAAHCFQTDTLKFVRLGEHDQSNDDCTDPDCPINAKPTEIYDYLYNNTTFKHDIALIRLAKNVLPTNHPSVHPICLPLEQNVELDLTGRFIIAGWGKTKAKSRVGSDVLRYANIVGNGQCSTCHRSIAHRLPFCPLSGTRQICLQTFKRKSSCQGDSGGPLMVERSNRIIQVGIVSIKPGQCDDANIPSVYTRIDEYIPWILDNMRP